MTREQRMATRRAARRPIGIGGPLRASLSRKSGNRKLGGIPSSVTSQETCPDACSFKGQGCYAEFHVQAAHWRRVCAEGDTWPEFLADVRTLPPGQLWRHNVAGDLPGEGDACDPLQVAELVEANMGRRGFTFSHKPVGNLGNRVHLANRLIISYANENGLVVNLSADDLEQADELAAIGIAPVAVVLAKDAPQRLRTPAGRRVVVCPAQTPAALTCATCQLCAVPHRKAIVGFRAHGQAVAEVDERARRRLPVVSAV